MSTVEAEPTEAMLDGRYRLAECVGEGGMSRVFRAEDVALGRPVAIKLIRPGVEGVSPEARARSEMTVLASLNHPSLVTLYDAQFAPQHPEYLVMELVDGPTLKALMADGPLPPHVVGQFAAELAEALHVVHTAGIVHRDIKPSNVLLGHSLVPGRQFHAKLADFGIACLLDSARMTTPGMVVGTPAYLAPEQVRGAAPAAAADIYALGLVLLEALTGQPAYPQSSSIESAVARLSTAPTIPDRLDSEWADLLRRMTSIDPAARPCALEVAVAAGALAVKPGVPVPSPVAISPQSATHEPLTSTRPLAPVSRYEARVRHRSRRRTRRVPGGMVGALAAAAAGIVAIGIWAGGIAHGEPEQVTVIPPATDQQAPVIPATDILVDQVDTPAVIAPVNDTDGASTDEGQKQAEEARKAAEEQQERLAEEARTQAEEAQKQAKDAQSKLDEEQRKHVEEARNQRGRSD